ncbi:NAD-dependent epimerase/dehydratase family protein [Bacteroidota bacterium]
MIKKIFITGASGFIGRAVVERLRDNFELTLLLPPGEVAAGLGDHTIVRGDVTRYRSLGGLIKGHDTVIHMAGAVGYQSWRDCMSVNVDGSRNVIKQSIKAGVIRFIHMSSVSVYGWLPDIKVTEEQPFKKIGNPYGNTKIEAEQVVRKFAEKNRIDLTVLRPTAVYGKGDNKFLPMLIEGFQSGKFRMMGDGNHTVDLVHVKDVADAVYLSLIKTESIGQTYNIANTKNPSWNKFLKEVSTQLDIPYNKRHVSYKLAYRFAGLLEFFSIFSNKPPRLSRYAVRVVGRQYKYSNVKARKELGFEPSTDLIEGIQQCIRTA